MKTKKQHLVAFIALLFPAILFANSTNVTFDAALTNATGWTYNDVATNKDGNIYFNLHSSVLSPTFPFNITSIEITLSCSNRDPSRYLQVIPSSGEATNATPVAKANTRETQSFEFDQNDAIRSFSMAINGGGSTGNWYIYSAVISGVPLIEAPTNLQADDSKGTRCRLSWANPVNAVSNRVEVLSIQLAEPTGTTVEEFGFDEISAGGNAVSFAKFHDSLPPQYEKLSGTNLYAAANSTGLLQISTRINRGELVYSGYESYADLTLMTTLKRYSGDANTMTIGWTDGGATTNILETINLADDFTTEFIDLSSVADGAIIIFNNSGNDDNHRVIIDEIAFIRDYSPASVSTNLVKTVFPTGSTTYCARGLSPWTEYIASITAFDADGNESEPSEPISFMTNGAELPLVIKLQ